MKAVGDRAFSSCANLEKVVVPISVERFGSYMFLSSDKVVVYCEAEEKPSGWNQFWNYYNRPVEWGYKE